MPFTITNDGGEGSDADIVIMLRAAIVQVTRYGHSYDHRGKAVTRSDLPDLIEALKFFDGRVAAAAATGPAVNYAIRGRAL